MRPLGGATSRRLLVLFQMLLRRRSIWQHRKEGKIERKNDLKQLLTEKQSYFVNNYQLFECCNLFVIYAVFHNHEIVLFKIKNQNFGKNELKSR